MVSQLRSEGSTVVCEAAKTGLRQSIQLTRALSFLNEVGSIENAQERDGNMRNSHLLLHRFYS